MNSIYFHFHGLFTVFLDCKRVDVPDLSGEGSLCNLVAVLCRHINVRFQLGPGKVEVDGWGTTHNLCQTSKRVKKKKKKIKHGIVTAVLFLCDRPPWQIDVSVLNI